MMLHTSNGRTWARITDAYGNEGVLEYRYAALDTAGAHEIRFYNTDYYHIHNGGSRRIMPRDLYGVLAHVQGKYGRECAGIDNSGRYMAGWRVGDVEPVDELEAWLLGV